MAKQMTATEVKAKLLALLDEVEKGEEIVITRRGRTIARILPARGAKPAPGWLQGVAKQVVPDEELFSTGETWEVMRDDDPA